jgi:HSP20 family protein
MLAKWSPQNGGIAGSFPSLIPSIGSLQPFFDVAYPRNWAASAPAADVLETENDIQVIVDLPGHDPKSVQVTLEGDTLTIQAERKQEPQQQRSSYLRSERSYGIFTRAFELPGTVDGSKCEARYEAGVLTVTLPKRDEAKPKSIDIKVRS